MSLASPKIVKMTTSIASSDACVCIGSLIHIKVSTNNVWLTAFTSSASFLTSFMLSQIAKFMGPTWGPPGPLHSATKCYSTYILLHVEQMWVFAYHRTIMAVHQRLVKLIWTGLCFVRVYLRYCLMILTLSRHYYYWFSMYFPELFS